MAENETIDQKASRYLEHLPVIYQQDVQPGGTNFLGRFLLAFEKLLTGLRDTNEPGLEEKLDGIDDPVRGVRLLAGVERYFEPGLALPEHERAPAEFLEWLAGWVALSLRADLDELRQREFIAHAVSLYHDRGTKRGLEDLVKIYTRLAPEIDEMNMRFQVGVNATIGKDTVLDGGAPHYFRVTLRLSTTNPDEIKRQGEVVTAIIDMEKPAHTTYNRGRKLLVVTPILQIGVHSTVGVDTLLG
jgi:phage tail-like protein